MQMNDLLLLVSVVVGTAALLVLGRWLERATHRPGLRFVFGAIILLTVAVVGLTSGYRLLPLLFAVQSVLFLYHARWRNGTEQGRNHTQVSRESGDT
jgi:hypothetical protein